MLVRVQLFTKQDYGVTVSTKVFGAFSSCSNQDNPTKLNNMNNEN